MRLVRQYSDYYFSSQFTFFAQNYLFFAPRIVIKQALNEEALLANGEKMVKNLIFESTDQDQIYVRKFKRIPKIIQQAAVLSVLSLRYPEIRELIGDQAERLAEYANTMLDQNEIKLALPG